MASSASLTEIPYLIYADRQTVFRHRAERLSLLAGRHPAMAGYLGFLARLAEAQHSALLQLPVAPSHGGFLREGEGPLDLCSGMLPPGWQSSLRIVTAGCRGAAPEIDDLVRDIEQAPNEQVDEWGRAVLAGDYNRLDPGRLAVLAAALQVAWTGVSGRHGDRDAEGPSDAQVCPVCGSQSVCSIIFGGGALRGLRYLCCSLCSALWNLPRIRCVHCGFVKCVAYYQVEGSDGAVKAEACSECGTYSKVLNREKAPGLDAFADDLASLGLDILLAEQGFVRVGANPFLVPAE